MQLAGQHHGRACIRRDKQHTYQHGLRQISWVSAPRSMPVAQQHAQPGLFARRLSAPSSAHRSLIARGMDNDEVHEAKLGPGVASGVNTVKEGLSWSQATVMRNEAITLDGSHRLLQLSVSDPVDMLYGRKIQSMPDSSRWTDSYTMPGQFVGLRLPGESGTATPSGLKSAKRLHSIACSPYESRRDSAYIDASIIEVVVEKGGDEYEEQLAELGPGAVIEVSQVVGRGFASLFNSYVGLLSALEEQRNLLVIAVGLRGIAPVRALLKWTPVQAHATAHTVSCFYVTRSPATAAFLPEWDQWREMGIRFQPLYIEQLTAFGDSPGSPAANNGASSIGSSSTGDALNGSGGSSGSSDSGCASSEDIMGMLDQALFLYPHGLDGAVGGRACECTVLLAGVGGALSSSLTKELTYKGVERQRLLWCDYF